MLARFARTAVPAAHVAEAMQVRCVHSKRQIKRKEKHPMYGKFLKRTKKFVAHDEEQTCNIGDTVRIMETRPMSKRKCWRLVEVMERAK